MKTILLLMIGIGLVSVVAMTNAEIVSNSLIVDDIECYMQADDSIYDLGEDVEMLYRITNLREEQVTFSFTNSPEWNFWAEKDEENIWRAVNGWWTAPTAFTLTSNESKEFPYVWDMRDNEDHLITPGVYDVIGGLDADMGVYDYTRVSVPIAVVPEPATVLLLGLGGLLLRS